MRLLVEVPHCLPDGALPMPHVMNEMCKFWPIAGNILNRTALPSASPLRILLPALVLWPADLATSA